MTKTEKLIAEHKQLIEVVAREAKKRIGDNPWISYEWAKAIIADTMEGDCGAYDYGIKRIIEVLEL